MSTPVPELDINKVLFKDGKVPFERQLEQLIVWRLLEHLEAAGFKVKHVHDGDDLTSVKSKKEAMELVFNLDDASLYVSGKNKGRHYVLLILGNGEDIISDYSYSEGDEDGFDAAMRAFDTSEIKIGGEPSVDTVCRGVAPNAAAVIDAFLVELTELGFGTDDPIDGADCVDAVNRHLGKLREAAAYLKEVHNG